MFNNVVKRYVFFWKPEEKNGVFSNWYPCRFTIDGVEYCHTEQYMMARKAIAFGDYAVYHQIMSTESPAECKKLGKTVFPFDFDRWDTMKYGIVKTANRAKYTQNPALMKVLLETGSAVLAEASPYDRVWGIGLNEANAGRVSPEKWPGENLLGRILAELRDEFNGISSGELGVDIHMELADITQLTDVEAIVNAANSSLLGGGGVDGAIHRAAGPELLKACRKLRGCKTGEAKMTDGYQLPYSHIIHTVGPVWKGGMNRERELLADCYKHSLQLAVANGIRTIAFPSISTGVYAFPVKEAANTAVWTVVDFIKRNPGKLDRVKWALFDRDTLKAYREALECVQI